MSYSTLSRAQLSFDYLHTNSTTHEFLFGALAELLDNARDASATKINIYTVADTSLRGGYAMFFLDDGEGMDPNETADIVTFGKSTKRCVDSNSIGMYGNGLKSGSMRLGNDLIMFTKKGLTMSCLFLSRTFHEEEGIDEVIVPLPSFEAGTRRPLTKGGRAQERQETEMELIYKYSPFRTEQHFFSQFDRIEGNSGTLVVVFNLKLLDDGNTELDVNSDKFDILLANPESDFDSDDGLMPERRSFRAYASILYMEPRMRIYIQGKKVHTKRLASCLYKPRLYKYSSNRFKTRTENEAKRAQEEALAADNKAREAESKAKNLEVKFGSTLNKEQRVDLRKAQTTAAEFRREADIKRQIAERKVRALKDPKTLNLIFGIQLENRSHDGVFVYNCSRLIKMYEKVGPQTEGGVYCSGVVGVVNVPYLVLEPTHNKQDFADAKEYRHLMKAMGEHMVQYWKDIGIAQQGITKFWENYGYISSRWKDPPSSDIKFVRKRAMQINKTLQCDLCLKWRTLPFLSSNVNKEFPDNWQCSMNPDQQHHRCTASEQKLNIQEGVLKKEVKSSEQKKKDLEDEILKKQEMLARMDKSRVVLSSKDALGLDRKKEEPKAREPSPPPATSSRRQAAGLKRQRSPSTSRSPSPSPPPTSRSRSAASKPPTPKAAPKVEVKSSPKPTPKPTVKPSPRAVSKPEPRHTPSAKTMPARTVRSAKEPSPPPASRKRSAPVNNSASKSNRPTPRGRAAQTKASSSEEEEDEEESEEEEEEVVKPIIPKRSRMTAAAAAAAEKAAAKTKAQQPTKVKEIRVEPPKPKAKPPPGVFMSSVDETEASQSGMEAMDVDMVSSAQNDTVQVNDADSNGEIGTRVEALINNKWHAGSVVRVNAAEAKWKVKFDSYPKDKYDKWYEKQSSDIKVIKDKDDAETDEKPPTPPPSAAATTKPPPAQETAEAPTSSTTTTTPTPSASTAQHHEEIANGYRTCLRYFLPPQWVMDKETISQMTLQELADFPLDDFFDHYERGLRRLVSNFQTEAAAQKQEAENSKTKLASVRKLIAKLLKSTNEEFDIDPEADGDQVDELLSMCVRQAVQS
ncbi:ATPase MORC2A-like [Littorina saxatilis]|uniref:CW-type domain-containing protein n=1 Tax=Littorina saxatilis TaxID=31220 RepID=A0AAN9AJU6_9CAEN